MALPSAVSESKAKSSGGSSAVSDPLAGIHSLIDQFTKQMVTTSTPAPVINVPKAPALPTTQDLMNRTTAVAGALQQQTTAAFQKNVQQAIPGYDNIMASLTANAQEMLTGALPKDVQEMINMQAAQSNLQGGLFGQVAGNRTARDIGKTSLDMMLQGRQGLEDVLKIGSAFIAPTVDVASLYNASQQADIQRASLIEKYDEMGVQNQQWAADFGIKQSQLSIQSANLGLAAAQAEIDKYKYDSSLAWDRQLSLMNRQFEVWSIQQQQALARQQMQQAQNIQNQKSADANKSLAAFMNADHGGSSDNSEMSGIPNAQRLNPDMFY